MSEVAAPPHSTTLQVDAVSEVEDAGAMGDVAPLLRPATASKQKAQQPQRFASRFLSIEFLLYYALLLWAHVHITYALYTDCESLLQSSHPPAVVDGWIANRKRDDRDYQLRFFRNNVLLLSAAFTVFVAVSQLVRYASNNVSTSFYVRMLYYAAFSSCFLVFCNGSGVGFMLAIVSVNFAIAKLLAGHWLCPTLTWMFNAAVLLLNERYDGYRYADVLGISYGYLDGWRGVFGWHSLFNLVVLRMISFNCDYHWALQAAGSAAASPTPQSPSPLSFSSHRASCLDCAQRGQSPCAAWRAQTAARLSDYNALTYYCYLFYPPLHFAGPTITFNHFVSNVRSPHQLPMSYLLQYAARLLLAAALLELLLHYLYVFALAQPALLPRLSVASVLALVYWTLNSIWLKFLIIWRFMRWWALLDGLEPVENMLRCVDNNHSVQEFWRDWHRAFNRWLIRYIYMPMGGNLAQPLSAAAGASASSSAAVLLLRRVLNVFIVFTWVAYWHDRTLQLLAWGCLISLVFVPELLASQLVRRTSLPASPHYRHVKSAGGAVNILLMMLVNLVGYSVGIGGTLEVLRRALQAGLAVWLLMFAVFFAAVQIQLEVRRREQWQRERLQAELRVMTADRGKALD